MEVLGGSLPLACFRVEWHSAPVDRRMGFDGRIANPPYGSLWER